MPTAEAILEWKIPEEPDVEEWEVSSVEEAAAEGPCLTQVSKELEEEILRASEMLKLEDDWDGEGSPAISKDTFDLAADFLESHSRYLWEHSCLCLPVPRISPGPNGSIDLHWKRETWELLVNIPADTNETAVFYGDNYGVQKINGSIDPKKGNFGITTWLMH